MILLIFEISEWYKSYHNQSHFGLETLFLQRKKWVLRWVQPQGQQYALRMCVQSSKVCSSPYLQAWLHNSSGLFFPPTERYSMQHLCSAEKDAP